MAESITELLQTLLSRSRELRRALEKETATNVTKQDLRDIAKSLSDAWKVVSPRVKTTNTISAENLGLYESSFQKLLQLSISPNRRVTYINTLDDICDRFRKDLIHPTVGVTEGFTPGTWDAFLAGLPSSTEGDYFTEAVDCAKAGFLRAAAVMGWCACVDHIHRKVAGTGFDVFSKTSEKLAAQTVGRFKRFNKKFSIDSIADLRATVFDDDLLVVIEGMGVIDNNEFRRLRSCFDLRNQAGHPGDAPITEYNLMSFLSDIVTIVLKNPKFGVGPPP
jgi:hypothetical protein